MRKAVLVLSLCLALALGLIAAGCGGGDDNGGGGESGSPSEPSSTTPSDGGGEATTSPTIGDNFFKPENITVKAGDTVTWTNEGAVQHTVTADDGSFDSGLIDPGKTFKTSFDKAGTFNYLCTLHAGQKGSVTAE